MKEQGFKEWLIQVDNKKESTTNIYSKAIYNISEHYSLKTKDSINIYEISDLKKLLIIRECYGFNGEYFKFGNKSNGTNRAAINAYYKFLLYIKKTENKEILISRDLFLSALKEFKYIRKSHKTISSLQQELLNFLSEKFNYYEWSKEFKPSKAQRDSIDIIGFSKDVNNTFKVVIELDTYRADQISKKYLSRMALLRDDDFLYVSICYPPFKSKVIKKTGIQQAEKYFNYCKILTDFINENTKTNKTFLGYIFK